jgi:hypothetical protein
MIDVTKPTCEGKPEEMAATAQAPTCVAPKPPDQESKPATLRLGNVTISADPVMREQIRRQTRDFFTNAVALQGARALENPLSSAKFHEAGHAVIYMHFGEEVLRCRIWQLTHAAERGQWVGETDTGQRWKSDTTTSPQQDFKQACCVSAGVLAEVLFDPANFRHASSLDEIVIAKMVASNAARKTRRHAADVLDEVISVTGGILTRNADVVREMAADLQRYGAVRKSRLRWLLGRVSQRRLNAAPTSTLGAGEAKAAECLLAAIQPRQKR